jgi:beta-sarcoglycan
LGICLTLFSWPGDESAVLVNLINRFGHNHNKFSISHHNGTELKGINLVDMRDPTTHESIFLFNKPKFHLNNSLLNLEAHQIASNRITSSVKESLHLQSRKGSVYVKGIEGTYLDGKEMLITGDQNIMLKSSNGTIELNSSSLGGVYIDLKLLKGHDEFADKGLPQYKLCVCMPQGRVFRVQIPKTAMTTRGVCAISAGQSLCSA